MMKNIFAFFILLSLCISCGPEPQKKHLKYQNIIILSDMSTRLDNLPSKDIVEIEKLVDYFKSECVKPGEKIGDRSSITFSPFSANVGATVDISQIKSLRDKQSFINSTGKYKNSGLNKQLKDFKNTLNDVYKNKRDKGLDLISVLIEKIQNQSIIKKDTILSDGIDSTFINYENHIYIFTDGYLEYQNKSINKQFYFGSFEINKIRKYCTDNSVDIVTALGKDKSLCLPICRNSKNSGINLHVFETHERDKNNELQTYSHPTGLRDNEILESVWRKWAKESGFNSFEWKKY
jgi:hypothetical protein